MEYLRRIDFASLSAGTGRTTQVLLDRLSGATTVKAVVVRLTPGEGSPRGTHEHRFDQSMYILSGSVNVEIGGTEIAAEAGMLVLLPGGIPHRSWNPAGAAADTTYLEFSTPLPEAGESRESPDQAFDEATRRWVSPKR